jgi:hypothetical protein
MGVGENAMTLPDYAAVAVLIVLALWALTELLARGKFEL